MDKITFRRATEKDKEAVLRITENVYDGRDYLPAYYDYFLKSPNALSVVMLYGNKIIAYEVGQIIDNGETIVNRAGRVSHEFEAKGLIRRLSQYVYDWGMSKGCKGNVFTISDGSPYLARPSFKKVTKYILTRQYPWYYFPGNSVIFSGADKLCASALNTVSHSEIALYFKSEVVKDYISPEGRMVVDVVPYKMIEANIPYMLQPEEYMGAYSDIKVRSDKCSGLLSFGLVYPTPRPEYTYRLDIFGNDTDSLKTHIVKHLIRAKEQTTGVTAMLVYVSQTFDLEKVDNVFKEYGILRYQHHSVDPKLNVRELYAYEGNEEKSNL